MSALRLPVYREWCRIHYELIFELTKCLNECYSREAVSNNLREVIAFHRQRYKSHENIVFVSLLLLELRMNTWVRFSVRRSVFSAIYVDGYPFFTSKVCE